MSQVEADSIWVLSALDHFLSLHKQHPPTFIALFTKKKLLIDLIQNFKIDAKKYKAILLKAYKEQEGDVKQCAQSDLLKVENAKDEPSLQLWFRNVIETTGTQYEQQLQLYNHYQNSGSQLAPSQPSTAPVSKSSSSSVDVGGIMSFKALDNLM